MKTKLITLAVFAAAMTSNIHFLEAAPGDYMRQGDHEIIIKGTERIMENIEKFNSTTEESKVQRAAITDKINANLSAFKSDGLSYEEKALESAKGLENRALLSRSVQQMARTNGANLDAISLEIEKVQAAAERINSDNPEYNQLKAQIAVATGRVVQKSDELAALIANAQDESLRDATIAQYEVAFKVNEGTAMAEHAFAVAWENVDLAGGLGRLQEIIASRRTQLASMEHVATQNLENIRNVAILNGTKLTLYKLDNALREFTAPGDPVGLEILQPGLDVQFIIDGPTTSSSLINRNGAGKTTGRRILSSGDWRAN